MAVVDDMLALVPDRSVHPTELEAVADQTRAYVHATCAESDVSAASGPDRRPLPSAMAHRGAKAATIAPRLVVISHAHDGADVPTPTTSSPTVPFHTCREPSRRTRRQPPDALATPRPGKLLVNSRRADRIREISCPTTWDVT